MGLIDRRHKESISKTTDLSGSANAAEVKILYRDHVAVMYNFSALNGDIVVEGSDDGSNWEPHDTTAQADLTGDGNNQGIDVSTDAVYPYARVYYTGNDSDVNTLKLIAK